MLSKKIFHKKLRLFLAVFLVSFSVLSIASDNTVDDKIDRLLKAIPQEKQKLLDELKNDISEQKYNKNDPKNRDSSLDEKIKRRESKSLPRSKCGVSHGSKCGTSNMKCGGGQSHGSKCGSCD